MQEEGHRVWERQREGEKRWLGWFVSPCYPAPSICLNSNQAQGAQLSMRAVVQAAMQKGNLSWSRVWSGRFEVIFFSKEIISFVCTCSGKLPHQRLLLRTFGS